MKKPAVILTRPDWPHPPTRPRRGSIDFQARLPAPFTTETYDAGWTHHDGFPDMPATDE